MIRMANALIQWLMRTASGWITARCSSGRWPLAASIDALPTGPGIAAVSRHDMTVERKCQRKIIRYCSVFHDCLNNLL
jgi:hypothetical protein